MGAVQRCSIDLMAFQRDVRTQLPALFHLEPSICLLISSLSRRGNKLGAAALCHDAKVNFQSADRQESQRSFSGREKMAGGARRGSGRSFSFWLLLLDKCKRGEGKKEKKNPSQFNVVSYNPFPGCTIETRPRFSHYEFLRKTFDVSSF